MTDCTDVVVVGGGPAGSAAALTLRAWGASVTVVERTRYETQRIGETLPPGIQCELAALGVWEEFLNAGHLRSPGLRCAWGDVAPYERSTIFNPYGPGWHVDRRAFDAALANAAEARGARVLRGHRLAELSRTPGGEWLVRAEGHNSAVGLTASVVIDATGRVAAAARRLGALRRRADRLVALFRFTRVGRDAGPSPTTVEAVCDGWWYTAPLPDGRTVVALMTDADLASRGALRDPVRWTRLLESAALTCARVGLALEPNSYEGAPLVTPADSSFVVPNNGDGWYAVGDAAVALDPLSGDGVRRALRSGMHAAGRLDSRFHNANTNRANTDRRAPEVGDGEQALAFESYLYQRDAFYGRERRWPQSPFWRRRHRAHVP